MDQDTANEVRQQNLLEEFDQYLTDGEWAACRETLTLLEDMHVDTRELRRAMNTAMADDLTFEPIAEFPRGYITLTENESFQHEMSSLRSQEDTYNRE